MSSRTARDARPRDLPDFDNPPVVETVLSVEFEPLKAMRMVHFGLLWKEYIKRFPRTEARPPLESAMENFPESAPRQLGLQLRTYENPPTPRLCFLNGEGTELLQFQPDRFIKNWRKRAESDRYTRYERNKKAFDKEFATFQRFVSRNKLGAVKIRQCEVTYVNHIVAGDGWKDYSDIERIFTIWVNPPGEQFPGHATDIALHARFTIPDQTGQPIGRLHADISPAIRTADSRPMYVLNLTARGQLGDGYDFLDLGRRWIVKSFAELTTPDIQKIWRRKDHRNDGA